MSKKFLLAMPFIFISVADAAENYPVPEEIYGLKITTLEKQPLPDSMKNEAKLQMKNFKLKGFSETGEPVARHLLDIDKNAPNELRDSMKSNNHFDTRLKSNLSSIRFSIPVQEVRIVPKQDFIGFAPIGSYDREKNGWNGFKQFFKYKSIGNCSFSKVKVIGASLSEEMIDYSVNKKPTIKAVEGSKENGFLYKVEWFSDDKGKVLVSTLECANRKFDPSVINQMIETANEIDKS